MVHQTYRGETIWTFPGGSIEADETPKAAAVREAKEETSLDIAVVELLYQGPRQRATGTYYCYLGRIVGGRAELGHDPELSPEAQELDELRWFPLEQARTHPEVSLIWENLSQH